MDDYDFYYSYNKITKVRNKKERIDVQFIVIDESVEKSKRPNRLEIYYGIKDKKIYLTDNSYIMKGKHGYNTEITKNELEQITCLKNEKNIFDKKNELKDDAMLKFLRSIKRKKNSISKK